MKIEEGKYYRTRDGRKVGPMDRWPHNDAWQSLQTDRPLKGGLWNIDGTALYAGSSDSPDLIAEWTDGPVRTVTRREVVPGVWSRVSWWPADEKSVTIKLMGHPDSTAQLMTAPELKAAAAVLLELARALEE